MEIIAGKSRYISVSAWFVETKDVESLESRSRHWWGCSSLRRCCLHILCIAKQLQEKSLKTFFHLSSPMVFLRVVGSLLLGAEAQLSQVTSGASVLEESAGTLTSKNWGWGGLAKQILPLVPISLVEKSAAAYYSYMSKVLRSSPLEAKKPKNPHPSCRGRLSDAFARCLAEAESAALVESGAWDWARNCKVVVRELHCCLCCPF